MFIVKCFLLSSQCVGLDTDVASIGVDLVLEVEISCTRSKGGNSGTEEESAVD